MPLRASRKPVERPQPHAAIGGLAATPPERIHGPSYGRARAAGSVLAGPGQLGRRGLVVPVPSRPRPPPGFRTGHLPRHRRHAFPCDLATTQGFLRLFGVAYVSGMIFALALARPSASAPRICRSPGRTHEAAFWQKARRSIRISLRSTKPQTRFGFLSLRRIKAAAGRSMGAVISSAPAQSDAPRRGAAKASTRASSVRRVAPAQATPAPRRGGAGRGWKAFFRI